MPDFKTVIELAILGVTLTATIVGMQWRLAAVEKASDERTSALEKAVTSMGMKLDDARTRLTGAERDLAHQSGALARIETAINTATARLEVQIGNLQRQLVDGFRKEG